MKDTEIVGLFLERSQKALEETQNQYSRYCFSIALNVLGSEQDAEECVNEALLCAWNSIPPQQPSNLRAYMGKLTRDISISRWRENRAAKRCPAEVPASLDEIAEIAADDEFVTGQDRALLSHAISDFLRSLPETDRNLMIRRYWYCDSVKSISERFSFSEGKVRVRLHRAAEKLRNYLKKEGFIV